MEKEDHLEKEQKRLYEVIGEKTMEVDWLKKKLDNLGELQLILLILLKIIYILALLSNVNGMKLEETATTITKLQGTEVKMLNLLI